MSQLAIKPKPTRNILLEATTIMGLATYFVNFGADYSKVSRIESNLRKNAPEIVRLDQIDNDLHHAQMNNDNSRLEELKNEKSKLEEKTKPLVEAVRGYERELLKPKREFYLLGAVSLIAGAQCLFQRSKRYSYYKTLDERAESYYCQTQDDDF
jgi:hypothetical protein